ncbi:MAG: TauD/TfdA family dioxygenase [Betaproteobacteria bacterium]
MQTIDHVVVGKKAWMRADITRDDWLFRLTPDCRDELNAIVADLRRKPQPAEQIDAAQLPIPACRALMRRVQAALDDGVRFAVVDRLPMDDISDGEAKALYWILSSLLARPVQQKLTGTLVYYVHDTGKKATPGSGVRPDQTNMEQFFHNDNSYNTTQPEYVALLCVRPAKSGGVSQVISFYTLHNELVRAHQDIVPRLYQPFWFDRQAEYLPGEPAVLSAPIFSATDGRLKVRLGLFQATSGYTMKNETMDEPAVTAIKTLKQIFTDEALRFDFVMERGQIQYVNNLETGHRRTTFEDYSEPGNKRLMVRLWLRNAGAPRYQG